MCESGTGTSRTGRGLSRRAVLGTAAGVLSAAGAAGFRRAEAQGAPKVKPIPQPAKPGPKAFMARAEAMRALAVRSGDQGYGAVIAKDGRIVGQAPSRVVANKDPTAHAEVESIRDAARRLGTPDLSGCIMYGTFQACPMCETAAYWANIAQLYYGADIHGGGRPRYGGCAR